MILPNKFFNFDFVIRFFILSFPITFIIGSAFVNLYLLFFLFFFLIKFKEIYKTYAKVLILLPILIWLYIVLITFINNYPISNNYNIENLIKAFFYLRILILPVTLAFIINLYPDLRKNLFNTLIITLIIISIDIIIQFIFGVNLVGLESRNSGMRNSSFFGSELISGSFISKFSTLVLALIFIKQVSNKKVFYYFLLVLPILIICAVLLSGERMAFLNTIFAFFLFLLFTDRKKLFFFIPIIFIFLSVIIFSSEKLKKRFIYNTGAHLMGVDNANEISVFNEAFSNLENGFHMKIFLNSVDLSKDQPIFGHGLKSYRHRCFRIKGTACSIHPHNFYLELIHDGGITLFLLYYYFFIIMFINNFKLKIQNHYNFAVMAILITFINPIQITGSIFSTWNAGLIFFIFSLTLFPKKNELR